MKLTQIIPITILALALTATLVKAAHTSQVLLNPSEWTANTDKDLLLSVRNANGDNIVKVELDIPVDSNQNSIYIISDIGRPADWTYQVYAKKIVWTSTTGIAVGDSVDFGFTTRSPASGQYQWSWTTTDVNGGTFTGTSTTKVSLAPVSYFKFSGVPQSVIAGNAAKVTVKIYGNDGNVKTDYVGTISFSSTDTKAIIPATYTFTSSDKGSKDFYITYKTIGGQTFTVTDLTSKISQKSAITNVNLGTPVSITITPDNSQVNPGNTITYKAVAKDKFENTIDVTKSTKWSIDQEAGGSWNSNVYTAKNEGMWTITGVYNSLIDGTTLIVSKGATPTPTPIPTPTPTPNVTNVTPTPQPLEEMNIKAQDSVTIAPGSNETFVVTVNNVGSEDLNDVSLSATNISSDWITSYPSKITIGAGESKDFLVVINVPANISNQTISDQVGLVATSSDGTRATKNLALIISNAPTGLLGLSKNLLNLGIVIVAVAALVLIAWELWFRKK